jgi:dTDP-4-dehydrorhamnose 3,5-epimerase
MIFRETPLKGAYIIEPEPYRDERGIFARLYCKEEFLAIGHDKEFVQSNLSVNHMKGTFRGLHYQRPPFAEIKLIRCSKGAVYDIIVDLRKGSSTFLHHFSVVLTGENMNMLYVPEGFAHGFLTLEDDSRMTYQHTAFYKPGFEAGLRHDDPALQVKLPEKPLIISDKDLDHPLITETFKGI